MEPRDLLDDAERTQPVQDNKVSAVTKFYSGTKRTFPLLSEDAFIFHFHCGETDCILIENYGTYKLSEYNFGTLLTDLGGIVLEFKLPMHSMFQAALACKWPTFDFEYVVNVYQDMRVAIYELPSTDYWAPVLSWFAWQCLTNGISFFDFVKLLGEQTGDYGTVFA
ncbi:hypothetical protein [Raptor adenovirus 1]|uniref:Uncharacterized protein n=1 Tax=Raptor adenovirus 1 TaxID=1520002 RepID=F4MI13_9ADEN|nr:hypothetical protein RAdV-1_gp23 [Raptor adenovirus 1]AEC32108.1 hypothetical protein [Raptor adenovirus 1]